MKESDPINKVLDVFLEDAVAIAVKKMDRAQSEQAMESFVFSEAHEKEMKKIIKTARQRSTMRKIAAYTGRVAIVLLIMIAVSGVTVFSVEAWRVRFLNMFVVESQVDSDVSFWDETAYSTEHITLGYIPDGYKLTINETATASVFLQFEKGDLFFCLSRYEVSRSFSIDTESAAVKKINVNGHDTYCSETDAVTILVWNDDAFSYSLTGNIEKAQLICIAENVN